MAKIPPKKKTKKTAPVIQTRWKVSGIWTAVAVTIEGRNINDRQIIYLPRDQKYLDGLEAAGYTPHRRRA